MREWRRDKRERDVCMRRQVLVCILDGEEKREREYPPPFFSFFLPPGAISDGDGDDSGSDG